MNKRKSGKISLKWGLFTTVLLCWVVPIFIIVSVAGILMGLNYEREIRNMVETKTRHAMDQLELRMDSAIDASKAASYDGVIRGAYREYRETGDSVKLYSEVTEYLSHEYARDTNFKAVFLTFPDISDRDYVCVVEKGKNSYNILREYQSQTKDWAMDIAGAMDTGICFREKDGQLYMIRNLLGVDFKPYGVLTMICDKEILFQSLDIISSLTMAEIQLDDVTISLTDPPGEEIPCQKNLLTQATREVSGHTLTFTAQAVQRTLWDAMPGLKWAVALLLLLVVPLLFVIVWVFCRHVTHPLETVVNAANRVQAGERGYLIQEVPRNREFQKLTEHFNAMSAELKSQFDRLYLEQQMLQEARIKALQSQIDPHFLGNTLEIINWEARLAEDDKVSAMIEALSTMLDAAIGRDGRSQIRLKEELSYVDAYLYIIQQRMGDGLTIKKEIQRELLDMTVPKLILQPLAENAVEHDISCGRGSELILRAYAGEGSLYLEVEHEGSISPEDRENIDRMLASPAGSTPQKGHVGIRNLCQRLKLIYGDEGSLTISEVEKGRILARVRLPLLPLDAQKGRSEQG